LAAQLGRDVAELLVDRRAVDDGQHLLRQGIDIRLQAGLVVAQARGQGQAIGEQRDLVLYIDAQRVGHAVGEVAQR
jgi:hypothetical protein